MSLRKIMEEYRDLTIELIKNVQKVDEVNILLEKRERLIADIDKLDFTQEEFKELFVLLDIIGIEKKLLDTLNCEKNDIRKKINAIKITKEARMKYENSKFMPTFFNKKA